MNIIAIMNDLLQDLLVECNKLISVISVAMFSRECVLMQITEEKYAGLSFIN